ncbi:putative F-box protein [Arabidopsis thaliana]
MDQSDKNPNRRLRVIPKWSELCPDLLRSIFEQLSFTNLNRAKLVCRSWNSASRGCVPKRNQIPWLILFPQKSENNSSNNCVLFVPDDNDKVYKTRDLGVDFAQSICLATYGSWLLMFNHLRNLYILNH